MEPEKSQACRRWGFGHLFRMMIIIPEVNKLDPALDLGVDCFDGAASLLPGGMRQGFVISQGSASCSLFNPLVV